jgi:hypothetical protein
MTPSTLCAPAIAHFSMTPLTSRAPSTSTTPPAPRAAAKLSSSSTTSTCHTSDIKCHRCHGVGHFERDCPRKKSYIWSRHTEEYNTKTYVVQRVLSAQVDTSEKLQRHNLFSIFFVIKDCRVCTIIDGGSCNNLVSVDFVAKIGLTTHLHTYPYYIQWLKNSGKAKVTHTARVHFSIDT